MNYRPNEFARIAGVTVKTLHRWDESGKLKAFRTLGGHRYYTDQHINQIRGISPTSKKNIKRTLTKTSTLR